MCGGAQGSAGGGEGPRDFAHFDGLGGRSSRLLLAAVSSPSTDGSRLKPLSVCCRIADVAVTKEASLEARERDADASGCIWIFAPQHSSGGDYAPSGGISGGDKAVALTKSSSATDQ